MAEPASRIWVFYRTHMSAAALAGLCLLLTACTLPEPHTGQSLEVGRVYSVTSGSAFNISIGMRQAQADFILDWGGAFHEKYRNCETPNSVSDVLVGGHITNFDPPSSGCGADDLVEMWRADTFMRLAGWEDLILYVRHGRVTRIGWARLVGYIG